MWGTPESAKQPWWGIRAGDLGEECIRLGGGTPKQEKWPGSVGSCMDQGLEKPGAGRCFAVGDRLAPGRSEGVVPVGKDEEVNMLCLLEGAPGDYGGRTSKSPLELVGGWRRGSRAVPFWVMPFGLCNNSVSPLRWLLDAKELEGQMAQWIQELGMYELGTNKSGGT